MKTVQQIAENTPYLFINDAENNKILVCKKDWFEWMPITDTYNRYGMQLSDEYERYCDVNDEIKAKCEALGEYSHCEECQHALPEVKAYNYWDGSNHQSLIIESTEFDTNIDVIVDDEEIAKYHNLVEKAVHDDKYPFREMGTGYRGCKIDKYEVVQSQWQDDFELYFISEAEK